MGYATRRQCSAVQPPSHHVGNKATDIIAGQYQQDTFNLNVQNTGQQIQISWILICFASSPSGVVVTRAEKNIEALFNLCNCLLNIFPFKKRNKNHPHNPYVQSTTKVIKIGSRSNFFPIINFGNVFISTIIFLQWNWKTTVNNDNNSMHNCYFLMYLPEFSYMDHFLE